MNKCDGCPYTCDISDYLRCKKGGTEQDDGKELSEYEKFILSQMVNSDVKTIEEIGLMYQKQLAEICQQQNF